MFFFYAKYIQRNNKESLLIQNIDFYKYYNAINFYSGLTLNSDEILLQSNICVMDKIEINFEKMNEYIQLYYGKEKKSEEQRFCVNKKSEEEINSELDNREKNECIIENEYDNIPDINLDDRKNDIFSSLLLLCNVLKNSDYVANELKNESLEYCLDCFSFIICNFINRMDKVVNEKFDEAEVEKENIKKDIIILITAVMQDIITSALGTTMLEEQIKNIIQSPKNILVEFLVCMISADLEINNYLNYVENLIEKVENTLLLNCVLLKLEIIFLERNYSKNTSNKNKTLKLIESILRKIYGNSFKTKDSKRNKPNSNYMLMENINNHIENLKEEKKC